MSNVAIKHTKPILEDERGLFFEVLNSINIKHVVVTTFHKGAIRGNQFRKNMDQYFFLTTGKIKLITQSVDGHDRQEAIMTQGSLAYIPRGIVFVSIAEEESILLELSPQEYDPKNPDINRLKIV